MTCNCHCHMYGPVKIGGPCPKCGLTHDAHVTCAQHSENMHQQIKRLLRGVDFGTGTRIPNGWAGIPHVGKS